MRGRVLESGLNELSGVLLRYCGLDCKPRQTQTRGSTTKPNSLTVSITETVEMRTAVDAGPVQARSVGLWTGGRNRQAGFGINSAMLIRPELPTITKEARRPVLDAVSAGCWLHGHGSIKPGKIMILIWERAGPVDWIFRSVLDRIGHDGQTLKPPTCRPMQPSHMLFVAVQCNN